MKCRWCDHSETGLCYAHFEARRARRDRIWRLGLSAGKLLAVALTVTAAYGWLR